MFKKIIKRDGKIVDFKLEKIEPAIAKAGAATGEFDKERAKELSVEFETTAKSVISSRIPTVEQVQDAVELTLKNAGFKKTARAYADYRAHRSDIRISKSDLMNIYRTIACADASEDSDVKRGNANVDGNSAMGKMLQFGAEGSKVFAKTSLMKPEYAYAHNNGDIHIHDLDFYATGTLTCCQTDPLRLFKHGFNTGHGHLRTPQSIGSTEKAPAAVGPYSQAVVINGLVYMSGQIALNPSTGELMGTTKIGRAHV